MTTLSLQSKPPQKRTGRRHPRMWAMSRSQQQNVKAISRKLDNAREAERHVRTVTREGNLAALKCAQAGIPIPAEWTLIP